MFARASRHELWRLLMAGEWMLTDRSTGRITRDFTLTPAQFEALVVLRDAPHGELAMARLSGHLLYSSGSAAHLVDQLVARGLVARGSTGGDARRVDVALTAPGRDLIERALEAHRADLDDVFAPLVADDELAALTAFARRLVRAAQD